MADPLITVSELEARLGRSLAGAEATQAAALIDDASALVRDIASPLLDDVSAVEDNVPASVVPVVVAMVRRGLENPRGLTGETVGGYSYQTTGAASGVFATRGEKRVIRRAVGKLGATTTQMDSDLPLRDEVFASDLQLEDFV